MKFIFCNILLLFIIIKDIKSITNDALKNFNEKINENTIEKEVNRIIQDFTDFNERYNELVERQNKEKDNEDYDRTIYKEKYKQLFEECEIFYEYFYRQRKRLSDFINKPTGKIPDQILNAHNSILEYVLDSKNLVQELGEKAFIDKSDL